MHRLGKMRKGLRNAKLRMCARSRSGSAVVEFALVAPVFFLLLFGILETGLIFFASSDLENATNEIARMIRTGQAQSMTATQFRQTICDDISPLLACNSNLQVDVESYSQFGGTDFSSPIVAGALNPNLDNFSPGNAGDVVLVRTFYKWNVITPLLRPFFANLTGGQHLISSTAAFRNEPFS